MVNNFRTNLNVVCINPFLLEAFTLSDVWWDEETKIGICVYQVMDSTDNDGEVGPIVT